MSAGRIELIQAPIWDGNNGCQASRSVVRRFQQVN